MEDSKGFLSFNFEGSLNVAPSSSFAVAPSSLLILHNSSTIAFAGSNKGLAAPTPSAVDLVGSDNVPDQWNFRQMVCRHWLHHLCMKGDAYGFLHQYNKERMLVCHFFRLYGEYWKQDGSGDYALVHEDKKETFSKRFLYWWSLQQAGGRESNYERGLKSLVSINKEASCTAATEEFQ
ncbi:30-kDa cleavage and polyadenylation specificity factor 30 [Glycine max]|nr:30-kDa cleavage and polyadenylation specificity factor 30 [Glycine max]